MANKIDQVTLPRIHRREKLVTEASGKLREAIYDLGLENTLTMAEHLQVLTSVFNETVLGVLKYAIRKERHGNIDKPGGWE